MRSIGALYLAVVTLVPTAVHAATLPNILLITSEDNGPELGCYGDPYARTPHLDQLAEEGVRFDRAFVVTASCSESRSALLTGLFPHQNGQIGLATHLYRQFPDTPNIVQQLKAKGYRTGLIGKLHVNPEAAFPFDYRPGDAVVNSFADRDVHSVARAAGEFFQAGEGPFFLMVNYADAHLPFLRESHGLPENPLDAEDVTPLPWIGLDTPGLRAATAAYYNCLSRLDTGIGALLTALAAAGAEENTLVIYLGDHGAQFPRGKLASFESSLRVPLLVRWPGNIEPRQVKRDLVSSLDIAQTIYEATAVQSPVPLPGRSLLPLFSERPRAWREYLFTEFHAHYPPLFFPQRTVRDDRFKLIVNLLQDRENPVAIVCSGTNKAPQPSYVTHVDVANAEPDIQRVYARWRKSPPVELYDLASDPYETKNLADDPAYSETKSRLLGALADWQEVTADPLADPAVLAQLTEEHDVLPKPYKKNPDYRWKYTDYLQPEREKS